MANDPENNCVGKLVAVTEDGNAWSSISDDNSREIVMECAVCLLPCVQPVRLPCSHVFCYLCMKGAAGHSRRCALCRAEIPENFVRRPTLVLPPPESATNCDLSATSDDTEVKYHWYYEGVGGWWEYDERTSIELEARQQEKDSSPDGKTSCFEILIAGFIYVMDLNNGIQYRRGDPRRRRRIKRNLGELPDCKGVAGLKCVKSSIPDRRNGDGVERVIGDRLDPSSAALPTGTVNVVPAGHHLQALDQESGALEAGASMFVPSSSNEELEENNAAGVDEAARQLANLSVASGHRHQRDQNCSPAEHS